MPFDFLVVEGGRTRALPFPAVHFFIGSDLECQLRFPVGQVQPRHAEIEVTGDRAFLTDLTGRGLVWVNGMPVDKGELRPGMLVRFGRVELMVRFELPKVAPASAWAAPAPSPSGQRYTESPTPALVKAAGEEAALGSTHQHQAVKVAPERTEPLVDATARRPTPFGEPSASSASSESRPEPVHLGDDHPQATAGGSRPLSVGSIIDDRYLILARLAAGGMGEVYKAQHVELGKVMAVKVMRRQLSQDVEFVARFKREAIATSGIGQINIVDISDFGRTEDGRFYFAMEYLDGITLASLVHREGPQPVDRVLAIGVQMARALAAAHSLGVVHRDLKPENVMLLQRHSQRDLVKVVDFGVAKLPVAEGTKGHTAIGMVVGTPQYMSPEQAKAIPVDARSDIYSMGLILYELLAGRPTFDAETPVSLMVKQVTEAPAPLELGADAPGELKDLVFSMLQKAPEDRPQTMAEIVEALEGFLGISDSGSSAAGLRRVVTPSKMTPSKMTPSKMTPSKMPPARPMPPPRGATMQAEAGRGDGTQVRPKVTDAPASSEEEDAEALLRTGLGFTPSRTPLYVAAAVVVVLIVGAVLWSTWEPTPSQTPVATETPVEVPLEKVEPSPAKPSDGVSPSSMAPPAAEVTLRLTTAPSGAEIWEGNTSMGKTPLALKRRPSTATELRFVLDGYVARTAKFGFVKDDEVRIILEKEKATTVIGVKQPPPPEKVEVMQPTQPEKVEVKQPTQPERPALPSLVDDPYAEDKKKPAKQLKDVAY